jgi:hypothetical protein
MERALMGESRLQRWSRKKAEAGREAELPPTPTAESELSLEEQELAINEALPEHGILEKYDLPDPDAIELGTDITGFMRKEIPEFLRRKALRSLWKSNPVLAVLDGLNDYDEDFTDAATAGTAVKTLYKVGQGLIDKNARVKEQAGAQIEEQTEVPGTAAVAEVTETSEPEIAVESSATTHHFEPPVIEADVEPAPRYRPRMRFDQA